MEDRELRMREREEEMRGGMIKEWRTKLYVAVKKGVEI